jgi:hypothetical protein
MRNKFYPTVFLVLWVVLAFIEFTNESTTVLHMAPSNPNDLKDGKIYLFPSGLLGKFDKKAGVIHTMDYNAVVVVMAENVSLAGRIGGGLGAGVVQAMVGTVLVWLASYIYLGFKSFWEAKKPKPSMEKTNN